MRSRLRTIALAALVIPFALTACATESATPASPDKEAKADLGAATARIESHTAIPEFEPLGENFDAAKVMAGKTIASIPVNSQIAFTQFYAKAAQRVAKDVGFKFTTWQNPGTPLDWGRGISQAITAKADLVELFAGVDPAQVSPQIKMAAEARIPVVAADTYDLTQKVHESLATSIDCACSEAARTMVDWAAVKADGAADLLVLTSSDIKQSESMESAMKDELKKVCPSCTAKFIDIPSSDWATKILPQVQTELSANPRIDYVLPIFDTMSVGVIQAITQARREDTTKIVTYNGTPSILDLMRTGDVLEMNVGQSNDWMAHANLDQEMRTIGGLKTNAKATWPLLIWTKDNVANAGIPAKDSAGYGDKYQNGFREMWGLASRG